MCDLCNNEEENKIDLTEEEIDNIIVERYNDKDEKTKVFIRKALRVHGDKFDYYKTEYKKAKDKVIITCRIHGDFEQSPNSHLKGYGCSKCSGNCRLTTKEFIKRARKIHGSRYNYDKVIYVNSHKKVEIICPEHGSFWQGPYNHLHGMECPGCNGGIRSTLENFIEKANEVHNNKYDYSKCTYVNAKTKVEIICPEHGSFWQTPDNHLCGKGCPLCNGGIRYTKEKFIEKAKKVHGDKYNYDKVVYTDSSVKVEIICPEHGSFWQEPGNHLSGEGCPNCKKSIGENNTKKYLETNNLSFEQNKYISIDNKVIYPDFVLLGSIWIEYNGIQHYEYSEIFHNHMGARTFLDQLNRDIEVRKYCKENNITLIEIPYTLNTYEKIADFLDKVLIQHIDPNTLVDYSKLYKLENTGLNLVDLFPT